MIDQSMQREERDIPGFVFYESYFKAIEGLKPRQRLIAYTAIMEYAFTGKEPELDGAALPLLRVILPSVKSSMRKYADKVKRSRKTGTDRQEQEDFEQPFDIITHDDTSNSECAKNIADGDVIIKENKNIKTKTNTNTSINKNAKTNLSAKENTCSDKTALHAEQAPPDNGNTHAEESESCFEIISAYAGYDAELRSLLIDWLSVRMERKQPVSAATIRLNLEELTRITAGQDKKAYLKEVIRRGWGTFFELEKHGSGGVSKKQTSSGRGLSDDDEFCERSFDMEEFDNFTLGLPAPPKKSG